MSKTEELRKVIAGVLSEACPRINYEVATDTETFPYLVYDLASIDLDKIERDDVILTIDVWDKNVSPVTVEEIADRIEDLLNAANLPTSTVLPTFFRISRTSIQDTDKSLKRRQLKFQIQNYYIGE